MPVPSPTIDEPRKLPPVNWHDVPEGCIAELKGHNGAVKLKYGTIRSGRGTGIDVIEIDTGPMQLIVMPTRGMSIWQAVCDGVPFKWESPIDGPVHPSLVPVFDPSGLGWLEGFDELMVRCGMVSNGAPDFNEDGSLKYPLHGREGNLPAHRVYCETSGGKCAVVGDVFEKRLFFNNLKLTARLIVEPGGREITIEDTITNLSATDAEAQMLYHINIGTPILHEGAKLMIPFEEMAPRNNHAARDIATWDTYPAPITGYEEQVHFFRLNSDSEGKTAMMLHSTRGERGIGVSYDVHTLPYFILWKNTAASEDGYVTGLEPATNFPNPRTFEGEHERVTKLAAHESVTHRVTIHPLTTKERVDQFAEKVSALQVENPKVHNMPRDDWSA